MRPGSGLAELLGHALVEDGDGDVGLAGVFAGLAVDVLQLQVPGVVGVLLDQVVRGQRKRRDAGSGNRRTASDEVEFHGRTYVD
mgnify:CR=1 FL=1